MGSMGNHDRHAMCLVCLCHVNRTTYQVLLMESNQNHLQHQPVCKKNKIRMSGSCDRKSNS